MPTNPPHKVKHCLRLFYAQPSAFCEMIIAGTSNCLMSLFETFRLGTPRDLSFLHFLLKLSDLNH